MEEQPDQAPALHRRASEWYERNGLAADAIRHALTARDFERFGRGLNGFTRQDLLCDSPPTMSG